MITQYNFNKLLEKLQDFFAEKKMNRARIKFITLFLLSIFKMQTVNFEKLGLSLGKVKIQSSVRRISRFMSSEVLKLKDVSKFIFSILPTKAPLTLLIDRTNWKYGKTNINILMLAVAYKNLSIPILFTMLDKRGNSNSMERIKLINKFIKLFGKESIDCIIGDREFVGKKALKWLENKQIRYFFRIKENSYVKTRHGQKIQLRDLFSGIKIGQQTFKKYPYKLADVNCYFAASKIKNREGKSELQIIVCYDNPHVAIIKYKSRWQIESMFKSFKSSGFNIEDTHLQDLSRIERLISLVMIAFIFSYLVGLYLHTKIKSIRICKHSFMSYSFVKYGLNYIAHFLLSNTFLLRGTDSNFLSGI